MKDVFDTFVRILRAEPRTKNVVCLFVALLSAATLLPAVIHSGWFKSVVAVHASLVVVVVVGVVVCCWLGAWMVWSLIAFSARRVNNRRELKHKAQQQETTIHEQLYTLSNWQRRFLLRLVDNGMHQIHAFEIGGYRAVWQDEMQALINKGIMRLHPGADVYEIERKYFRYISDNWDRETGRLN